MTTGNYIIVAVCLATVLFLVWKETQRANRSHLVWRIVSTVLTAACLLFMVIPFTIKVQGTKESSREIVWLTEGYHPDSLKIFLENTHEDFSLHTSDISILKSALPFHPIFIAEPALLIDSIKSFRALHVFGYGFTKDEIKKLNKMPVIFHASPLPAGLVAINWSTFLKAGELLLIRGSFNNVRPAPVKLILNGLHTNLDSLVIPAGKQQTFELRTHPKQRGRAVYTLLALAGKDTVESENIPVEVDSISTIKILILAASPDFENKFLKNWLFKNGYQLVIRTAISRDKYQKEYLNSNEVKVNRVTHLLLDKFDVVIADAEELAALSREELASIRSRVEEHGLGLIVKADSFAAPGAFYAKPFPVFHSTGNIRKRLVLHWRSDSSSTPASGGNAPALIRKLPGTQPLVSDEMSRIYCSSSLYGLGKLVVTTLNNTFSWQLAGNDSAYHSLWSMILQKAAPPGGSKQNWLIEPALPRLNEPVQITLRSKIPVKPQVNLEKSNIYFQQNPWLPLEWTGNFWPTRAGWQNIQTENGQNLSLYVYENTDWKSIYAYEKYKLTKKYAHEKLQEIKIAEPVKEKYDQLPLPKIYFYLIILVGTAYLWGEKKYRSVY
ncbi:MAG: hypothetical protein ABIN89_19300 [Chitinophagaceae bacterium]